MGSFLTLFSLFATFGKELVQKSNGPSIDLWLRGAQGTYLCALIRSYLSQGHRNLEKSVT